MEDSYGRPTTARPGTSAGIVFNRPPQFTAYSDDASQSFEDDESEDGDVFAYLPPSTAEQEQERQRELHQQRPGTTHSQTPAAQFEVTVPSLPYQDVQYPSPSHNPYARFPSDTHYSPLPGPSNIHSRLLTPHDPVTPSASTESYVNDQEGYRMSRINTRSSHQSGKVSHPISLAPSLDKSYATSDLVHRPSAKRRMSSKADSEIMTASMIDDESRVGSIKYVPDEFSTSIHDSLRSCSGWTLILMLLMKRIALTLKSGLQYLMLTTQKCRLLRSGCGSLGLHSVV
jgi:hypothetical protein